MNVVTMIVRLLMGLVFFVFGWNGFLQFIPQPEQQMSEAAMAFLGGLMQSGYMMALVSGTQVVVGALLLGNRFVPLALALIAPIVVNIVAVHVFLVPPGLVIALVVAAMEVYLAWAYRHAFAPMLAAVVKPD